MTHRFSLEAAEKLDIEDVREPSRPTEAPSGTARGKRPAAGRWCLGTRLVVAATAAWTVLLMLHILLADRWWPWLLGEAAPRLILVAAPLSLLAVVPLARPVRRWLTPVLILLLLTGAHLAGYGPR